MAHDSNTHVHIHIHRGYSKLRRELSELKAFISQRMDNMAHESQAKIDALVATINAAVSGIDNGINAIRADIAVIKAQHPEVNLADLEASVLALSEVKVKVDTLDAENPM